MFAALAGPAMSVSASSITTRRPMARILHPAQPEQAIAAGLQEHGARLAVALLGPAEDLPELVLAAQVVEPWVALEERVHVEPALHGAPEQSQRVLGETHACHGARDVVHRARVAYHLGPPRRDFRRPFG